MYRLIQHRWKEGSNQNFGNLVDEYGRKREAKGQLKAHLKNHIEMLAKHEFISWEHDVIVDDDSILILDGIVPIYMWWYEVEGLDEVKEPKKPKINLIAELEKLVEEHRDCSDSYEPCGIVYDIRYLIDRVKEKHESTG